MARFRSAFVCAAISATEIESAEFVIGSWEAVFAVMSLLEQFSTRLEPGDFPQNPLGDRPGYPQTRIHYSVL